MQEDHFDTSAIGRWTGGATFAVEPERTIAYAEATNDPLSQHLAGALAPPVFAIVPAFNDLCGAVVAVVPNELVMRILHGEQDFRFHRPIVPGETLTTRSKVAGIHGKPSGVVVNGLAETRDETGELVNEHDGLQFTRRVVPDRTEQPRTAEALGGAIRLAWAARSDHDDLDLAHRQAFVRVRSCQQRRAGPRQGRPR